MSRVNKKGLYLPQFEHDSCGVGFVADIKGRKSHKTVEDALKVLVQMNHRGATGAEENTGDGAGILTQIPHKFFHNECEKLHIVLPEDGSYAVGMVFLPAKETDRVFCGRVLEKIVVEEGQTFLGWRDVPVDNKMLGSIAQDSQPFIRQIFIGRGQSTGDNAAFERKLFVIRRWAKELITRENGTLAEQFYFASLSTRTIVYKGMLTTGQLRSFYPDLQDENFETAIALVHSRFSTTPFRVGHGRSLCVISPTTAR